MFLDYGLNQSETEKSSYSIFENNIWVRYMTRTELGRRTVICDIIRKSALYIKKEKLNLESLATQTLEYENVNNDDHNIFQLVRMFTPCYQVNPETQEMTEPLNKKEIQNQNNQITK